ncbi:hypothetical protein [Haloferula sp. BvORR071]|uniref:hypothetical protein n=1 Tax=Haloferula sp. BvORR071 TaxID=1396141 RepID=UPI00054EF47C|nr:hypothetical protein [Haloferula sp. BvORR071]
MLDPLAEPVYPLERAEFVRALATGQGRAMIHVERCGAEAFEDEILDAALFPKVYDTQCNGYGEQWLARLCAMAGLVDVIIFGSHGIEGGNGTLRCRLLKEFALQGHAAARPALREMCRYDAEWNDLIAREEIVELEGEEGFIFVVEQLGESLLADTDFRIYPSEISVLDEKCGKGTAMTILERESPGNPWIAAYHKAVLEDQARDQKKPAPFEPTVEEVIGMILTSPTQMPRLIHCGKRATVEERLKVAALDFTKMSPASLGSYLCYFRETGFPEFREEHLELLGNTGDRISGRARKVLSHHAEPLVRKAAYEALARGEVGSFVELLRSSGLAGDIEPVLEAISAPATLADLDECHYIGPALIEMMEANPAMRDLRLPMWAYQHNPCMICREEAVKAMKELPDFPTWVAQECLYDAREDIRSLVAT